MKNETKTFELEIKELSEEGRFSGYLSTFGNVDSGGDIVDPGAFKKTLRDKKSFPLLWAHIGTPDAISGSFSGREDEKGLLINGAFFLDLEPGLRAYKTAKKLIGEGIRLGLSMGFRTVKYMFDQIEGITVRRLKEVKLLEGSLTLWPMNELAVVESVKEEGEAFSYEQKPYPNEHACRLHDPDQYTRFVRMKRKHDGKEYFAIIGFKKGGGSEDQAYRYPKDTWSADEAGKHCKEHGGSFEAAKKTDLTFVCRSCGETLAFSEPAGATQPGAEPSKEEPGEFHSTLERIRDGLKNI